jgi:hypothetical protein
MQMIGMENDLLSLVLLVVPTDSLHGKCVAIDTSDDATTQLHDLLTPSTQSRLHRTRPVPPLTIDPDKAYGGGSLQIK